MFFQHEPDITYPKKTDPIMSDITIRPITVVNVADLSFQILRTPLSLINDLYREHGRLTFGRPSSYITVSALA